MKRKVFALLAGMMVLALGATTVMAADSPTAEDAAEEAEELITIVASDADVVIGEVSVTGSDWNKVNEVYEAIHNGGLVTVDGSIVTGDLLDPFDISMSDGSQPDGTITVTIAFDDDIASLAGEEGFLFIHLIDAGWEILPSVKNADGTYTLTFANGLSPVFAICDYTVVPGSGAANGSTGSASGTESGSPITGEASVLPILAVALLAGIVLCGKKVQSYR